VVAQGVHRSGQGRKAVGHFSFKSNFDRKGTYFRDWHVRCNTAHSIAAAAQKPLPNRATLLSDTFCRDSITDLTVKLSSPGGQLKNGDNDVLIEFRDSRGQLIEVGNVKFEINMNMPGMQMHEGATLQRTGTAGQYRAKINVGMAGDWTAKLSFEGPRGSGQTSFNLNTKS
jgi:hypothetical protein